MYVCRHNTRSPAPRPLASRMVWSVRNESSDAGPAPSLWIMTYWYARTSHALIYVFIYIYICVYVYIFIIIFADFQCFSFKDQRFLILHRFHKERRAVNILPGGRAQDPASDHAILPVGRRTPIIYAFSLFQIAASPSPSFVWPLVHSSRSLDCFLSSNEVPTPNAPLHMASRSLTSFAFRTRPLLVLSYVSYFYTSRSLSNVLPRLRILIVQRMLPTWNISCFIIAFHHTILVERYYLWGL